MRRVYNRSFEWEPNWSVEDFVRNNNLSEKEEEDKEWIKEMMKILYCDWVDENF